MNSVHMIAAEARANGIIKLGGELEFPRFLTIREAYDRLKKIGEEIGGTVTLCGRSILRVSPPHTDNYYVLDWYDSDRPGPSVIRHWTSQTATL